MHTLQHSVLIVEDDHELRRLFEHALVFEGFRVISAAHGGEGLQALNRDIPAVVVLDLVLPWVNGLEVLATMRASPRLRAVPVLVVTGTATSEYDLREYRPVVVLHKPVDIAALAPMVQQLLAVEGT